MRLNRYKRRAAAKVFFHTFSSVSNSAHQLIFYRQEWDSDSDHDLFTEGEEAYIAKLRLRLEKDAELCRQFGHRLCK